MQSRVNYVRKILLLMRKNLTQNQSIALVFGIHHFKGGNSTRSQTFGKNKKCKSPTNNKQLESFVGPASFYGRMIPDFATKMLPLKNMRNSDFSWGKMQQKAFEDIKKRIMC